MNRIYTILFVLIAFCSCNPMDDIYDNLDEAQQPIGEKIKYTLTDADYKLVGDLALKRKTKEDSAAGKIIKEKLYFASNASIAEYLPAFLKSTYPGLQGNSSMMVTYNYNEANYPNIGKVVLAPKNYVNVGGKTGEYLCFMSSEYTPSRNDMTKALSEVKAKDGDLKLVTYIQATEDVAGKTQNVISVTLNKYDYQTIFNWVADKKSNFLTNDKSAEYWFGTSKNPNFDIRVDKWKGYPHNVEVDAAYVASQVNDGIILALKSIYAKTATVGVIYNVTYAVYDGKNKTFKQAFKCTVAGSKPEFEVHTEKVTAVKTEELCAVYQFSEQYNNWSYYSKGIYILTSEDYKGMGLADAFTTEKPSANYVPQLLGMKFPYARPNEEMIVVTRNDNGKAFVLYTDRYTFTDGVWVKYSPVIVKEDQFIYSTDKWVFDPTVNHTMVKEDYDILVQWVKENKNGYFDAKYKNAEYWFGASTYKDNFDIRTTSRLVNDPDGLFTGKSEAEVTKIMNDKIQEGIVLFLETSYKDAQPTKDGVDMYYKISYTTYDGSNHYYVVTYKCISVGKFELSEQPVENK